jgi:tetratricopeptide (TPR) repeat protein
MKESHMKAKVFLVVFCLLVFVGFVFSQSAEELVAKADDMILSLNNMDAAKEILTTLEKALEIAENKYDVYWRMARINYYIGSHTAEKKDQRDIFSKGIEYAEQAIELGPERPDGHYWLAVNNGKFGESKGVLKSLGLVKPIKESLNKVIELDRSYEEGGADRVLGRVFFKVPGFAGGDKEESLKHLLKSKEFGPEDPVTLLYLAETYLALNRVEEARAELDTLLALEDDGLWISSIKDSQAEGKELLEHRKFKK